MCIRDWAGSVYKDSGASATDLVDGEVLVETSGSVNTNKPGEYTISYSATDSSGNKGKGLERKVRVVDTTGPVIVLNGKATVTHEAGSVYKDSGASATDLVDGDLSGLIDVVNTVNDSKPGNYRVNYSSKDKNNNYSITVRKVNVVDTTGPVIVLSGEATVTHEAGSVYKDSGASATDLVDGEVLVESSGSVNRNKPGEYTISYRATDSAGNKGKGVERKVSVVDTTGPVIAVSYTHLTHPTQA